MAQQNVPHQAHVTYYDILEVSPSARDEEIKQAYWRLAKEWHPDRNRVNARIADFKLKAINEAYAHLKNKAGRQRYNQMLKGEPVRLAPGNDNSGQQNGFRKFCSWLFMSDQK